MKRFRVGICIIALAAVLVTYGAYRGEIETAYKKAKTICLECIGIG